MAAYIIRRLWQIIPTMAGVILLIFTLFNVVGGVLWVVGITAVGYFFGNIPWVKQNLQIIIWGLILVPGLIAVLGAWRGTRQKALQSP